MGLAFAMPRPASRNLRIGDLNLPTYLRTVLLDRGLSTAHDVAALSEKNLRAIPGVGGMSIRRTKMALLEHGLSLRPPGGGGYRDASPPALKKERNLVPTRQPRKTVRRRSES
jgi:hypothetical protein